MTSDIEPFRPFRLAEVGAATDVDAWERKLHAGSAQRRVRQFARRPAGRRIHPPIGRHKTLPDIQPSLMHSRHPPRAESVSLWHDSRGSLYLWAALERCQALLYNALQQTLTGLMFPLQAGHESPTNFPQHQYLHGQGQAPAVWALPPGSNIASGASC